MVKTIKPMQVEYVHRVADLRPGMIVTEGIVLDVDLAGGTFATVSGPIVASGPIAVYARITPEMLVTLIAAVRRMKNADAN